MFHISYKQTILLFTLACASGQTTASNNPATPISSASCDSSTHSGAWGMCTPSESCNSITPSESCDSTTPSESCDSATLTVSVSWPVSALSGAVEIKSKKLDTLVCDAVRHILTNGEPFQAQAGHGIQAYDVSYTLSNPENRLLLLRHPASTKYYCRELLAYFNGSLNVNDGLAQASSSWKKLADANGEISSNYGHYVFHQRTPSTNETQYQWVIDKLKKNIDSRKAFININQPSHKTSETKDFPCTIGIQFYVRQNRLCCSVSSRSTDVYTGLPYDMGFFAFVQELVYKDLKEQLPPSTGEKLTMGHITMKTNFTQIYDKTRSKTEDLLKYIETPTDNDSQVPIKPFAAFTLVNSAPCAALSPINCGPTTAWRSVCKPCEEEKSKKIIAVSSLKLNTIFTPVISSDNRMYTPERKPLHTSMPPIQDAQATLQDIYQKTAKTALMQWIYLHAELPTPIQQ